MSHENNINNDKMTDNEKENKKISYIGTGIALGIEGDR